MTETMRVVEYDRYGGPEVLTVRNRPVPVPRAGEVVVQVLASGLNVKDAVVRAGEFRRFAGRRFPKSTGFDVCGVVTAVGAGVGEVRVGERVWALLDGWDGGGAADSVVLRADEVAPAPSSLDPVEAAGLPLVGLTALQALRDVARLRAGERVLVKGASGGVGSVVVQLAVATGARVTAVASAANLDYCRSLGAAEVVDYAQTDPADIPGPFDVVVDCVGESPFRRYRRLLTRRGRFVAVAPSPTVLVLSLLTRLRPGPQVRFVFVKPRRDDLVALAGYVERGRLRLPVLATYPLDRIADAHRDVRSRHSRGKRVLVVSDELGVRADGGRAA